MQILAENEPIEQLFRALVGERPILLVACMVLIFSLGIGLMVHGVHLGRAVKA